MNRNKSVRYSVIILLEETQEDFHQFLQNIGQEFSRRTEFYEILIIANGTEGFLRKKLDLVHFPDGRVKAFAFNKKIPQAVCLKAALKESCGEILMVCGSYQQVTSESLRDIIDSLDEKTDIVTPWRRQRVDPSFNQVQSKVFNWMVRLATGSAINDLSCTVKLFRRKVLEDVEIYGNMYRFLPILAERRGYRNKEVVCEHFQERGKTGFYRFSEYLSRLVDIFTIFFTTRFTWKPLRFFSAVGSVFILSGIGIMAYVLIQKIFAGIPIGERSEILLGLLLAMIGIQAAGIGLLGEIIIFSYGRSRPKFDIEKVV